MPKRVAWQARLPHRVQGAWRDWISEPGSLTRRCQQVAANFQVRLLAYRRQAHGTTGHPYRWCREVCLTCNGTPVIFAQTTQLTVQGGRLSCWLRGLGNRSLGSLLFSHPGFRRTPIEYLRLRPTDRLFQQAVRQLDSSFPVPHELWARRSTHALGQEAVTVVEVFLPGLAAFFHEF